MGDEPKRTMADHCRELEKQLTPGQWSDVWIFLERQGWRKGDTPPAYVWAAAYRHALGLEPFIQ